MDVTDLSRTCQIGNGLSRRSGPPGNVANHHRSSMDGSELVINVAYCSDDIIIVAMSWKDVQQTWQNLNGRERLWSTT